MMFSACGPLVPWPMSKETVSPSEFAVAVAGDVAVVGEDVGSAAVLLDDAVDHLAVVSPSAAPVVAHRQ
jgi:hypothetical protein